MNTQLLYGESQHRSSLPPESPSQGRRVTPRQIMICLAACMAMQMTSFVMILPLFARRFSQLGAGVSALGISEMAYALTATVAAPFMGALSDRIGRRPVVLGSLLVYALTFTGYLFAASASTFILLRGLAGALTAGLMPAATGMVADLAPAKRRAEWIGILSGGASIGWIAGPIIGGFLFDRWSYEVALTASISMASIALVVALVGIRETGPQRTNRALSFRLPDPNVLRRSRTTPASLGPLSLILVTSFSVAFAWAFIEPRLMFYAYDRLRWSSSMLGLVMSTYGISMTLGEFGLGRLSDTLGRKPVIIAGLLLFCAQFLGLALSHNYILIAAAFVVAGLGNALFDPALSASMLDVAPAEHQARMLGMKSTAGSIGNILGPALIVMVAPVTDAQSIFLMAAGVVLLVTLLMLASQRSAPLAGRKPQLEIAEHSSTDAQTTVR